MSTSEMKREVSSLAKRYPARGITSDIPAAVRMEMVKREQDKANKSAEKYFPSNPDPEAPVPAVKKAKGGMIKKYAKGGVTRADGCITKGRTKGRMV